VRAAATILVLLVLIWVIGLLGFAARVDRSTPAVDPPVSDGVVALTGASDARIAAAMQLLQQGKARRMLVSGVDPKASRADMRGVAKAERHIYDCCVDLGYQATDTVGNARETADWVDAEGYHSLILVTSDFHMPRALLELKAALPDAAITPYPIRTTELDARHWWRTRDGLRRMVLEYCKYAVILGQTEIGKLAPKRRHAPYDAGAAPKAATS
jgi:uncharacterized SAM-binding protein YcdF (DUF218 family)